MGILVEPARDLDRFAPRCRRLDIDLDDARIGRHLEDVEPRIGSRRIAFDMDRQAKFGCARFDDCKQFEIVREPVERRHEDAQSSVAHLYRQGRAHWNSAAAWLVIGRNIGQRLQRQPKAERGISRD